MENNYDVKFYLLDSYNNENFIGEYVLPRIPIKEECIVFDENIYKVIGVSTIYCTDQPMIFEVMPQEIDMDKEWWE